MPASSPWAKFPAHITSSNQNSTAGSRCSGHFSSLINLCAFQVRYLQQEQWCSPSSAYSVILSKQQRAKNVFTLENVWYGKNDTFFFFKYSLDGYQCSTDTLQPPTPLCIQLVVSAGCETQLVIRHLAYRLTIQIWRICTIVSSNCSWTAQQRAKLSFQHADIT